MWQSSESGEFSLPNLMTRCHKEKMGFAAEANASVGEVEKSGYGVKTLTSMATSGEHPRPNGEARGGRGRPDTPVAPLPPPHSNSHNKHSSTCMTSTLPPGSSEPGLWDRLQPVDCGWWLYWGNHGKGRLHHVLVQIPFLPILFQTNKENKAPQRWIKYPQIAHNHKHSLSLS